MPRRRFPRARRWLALSAVGVTLVCGGLWLIPLRRLPADSGVVALQTAFRNNAPNPCDPRTTNGQDRSRATLTAAGWLVETGAYSGVGDGVLSTDLLYLATAVDAVGGTFGRSRDEYRVPQGIEYRATTLDADGRSVSTAVRTGGAPVPVRLLPNPACVVSLAESAGLAAGSMRDARARGIDVGVATYLRPGWLRRSFREAGTPTPSFGAAAVPRRLAAGSLDRLVNPGSVPVAELLDAENAAGCGRFGGATITARIWTAAVSEGAWVVQAEGVFDTPVRGIAFPIADANGLARGERSNEAPSARITNTLAGSALDALGLPRALYRAPLPVAGGDARADPSVMDPAWPPQRFWGAGTPSPFQERFVLPGDAFSLVPPVFALCEAPSWRPLMEDYLLEHDPAATAERPRVYIAFVSGMTPAQLLRWVGALHGRPVDHLVSDRSLLARLDALRAEIRKPPPTLPPGP